MEDPLTVEIVQTSKKLKVDVSASQKTEETTSNTESKKSFQVNSAVFSPIVGLHHLCY